MYQVGLCDVKQISKENWAEVGFKPTTSGFTKSSALPSELSSPTDGADPC